MVLMLVRVAVVCGLLALSGCGVPSNPEKGPVVLLCEGEHLLKAGDGEIERAKLIQFYRVDGVERSLETWDDKKGIWMGSPTRIMVTANQISRDDESMVLGGVTSTRSISFDRTAGRVHEEFSTSNGGITTFDGACKPVKSPSSERQF